MKVLVIGGGGREHAIVRSLAASSKVDELLCAPGNGGIAREAMCFPDIKATDVDGVLELCRSEKPDYVMVAPDDPLAMGMVDKLEAAGFKAFGPRAAAAEIEASKAFAKGFMRRHGIPTAGYEIFSDYSEAKEYIGQMGAPIVIKADGLALGKGVVVAETVDEALAAAKDMLEGGAFGSAGRTVVVEEFMTGPEVTVLAFTDGETVVPMPSSRDHKRIFDGNRGPNTGGMGVISPAPGYTDSIAKVCMDTIFKPTVAGLKCEGREFRGVIFFGLMLTPNGPKVVEYNARFGDPECETVLPLLKSDLFDILCACREGRLGDTDIEWSDEASCCVVLASDGYPTKYDKGFEITGIDNCGAEVFHSGTAMKNGRLVTAGGRVLAVVARAATSGKARADAYAAAEKIHFKGKYMRHDIGEAQ